MALVEVISNTYNKIHYQTNLEIKTIDDDLSFGISLTASWPSTNQCFFGNLCSLMYVALGHHSQQMVRIGFNDVSGTIAPSTTLSRPARSTSTESNEQSQYFCFFIHIFFKTTTEAISNG